MKKHYGSDFRLLQAWQDQLDQHGHDGLVNYGNAIYLATNSSTQYQLSLENGEVKPSAMPSIVSIYGEKTLEINGDIVLDFKDHYSGSLLYIGAAEIAKVLINGDIHVSNDTDGDYENTINLDLHKGHLFIGSIYDHTQESEQVQHAMFRMMRSEPMMLATADEAVEEKTEESATETLPVSSGGTTLTLKNNHSTILMGESLITKVTANDASIMTVDNSSLTIKELTLEGGDTNLYTFGVKEGQFTIENLIVNPASSSAKMRSAAPCDPALGIYVGDMGDSSNEEVASILSIGSVNKELEVKITQEESEKGGKCEVTATIDTDGSKVVTGYQAPNTTVAQSINDVAGLSVPAWRAQMNDVNKCLGDLRTYQGNYGGWARVYGSESEYGDLGLKSKSHTVQVGADTKLGENFYFGATASYSDGKGTLNNGSTDDRSYSFGLYGGWMGSDGQFVDVIVKRANFKTDFDLRYTTGVQSMGSLDLWGTSLCAEYGWRLNVADGFWVEPQAEITYGYMNDVTYTYSGDVKATQEAMESLVGRLGLAFGTTFDDGSAYVKSSVAHDWMGETEISMSNGKAAMKEDLGGTWGEFAVGGIYNFGNGWAVYGEFQTAHGSKMKTPWQYNVGARYVF